MSAYNTYKGVRYLNYDIPDEWDKPKNVEGFINFFKNRKDNGVLNSTVRGLVKNRDDLRYLKKAYDLTKIPNSNNIIQQYAASIEQSLQQIQKSRVDGVMHNIEQYIQNTIDGKNASPPEVDMNNAEKELESLKNLIEAVQGVDRFIRQNSGVVVNFTAWDTIRSRFLTNTGNLRAYAQRIVNSLSVNPKVVNPYLGNSGQLLKDLKTANYAAKSTGSGVGRKGEGFEQSVGKFNEDLVNLILNTAGITAGQALSDAMNKWLQTLSVGNSSSRQNLISATIRGKGNFGNFGTSQGGPGLVDVIGNVKQMKNGLKVEFNDDINIPAHLGITVKRYNLQGKDGIKLGEIDISKFSSFLLGVAHDAKAYIYLYRAVGVERDGVAEYLAAQRAWDIIFGDAVDGVDFAGLMVLNGKLLNMVDFIQLCLDKNGIKASMVGMSGVPRNKDWWLAKNVPSYIDKIHSSKIKVVTAASAGTLYNDIET